MELLALHKPIKKPPRSDERDGELFCGTAANLTMMYGGTSKSESDTLRLYSPIKEVYQYFTFSRSTTVRNGSNTLVGTIPANTKVSISDWIADNDYSSFDSYGAGYLTRVILSN